MESEGITVKASATIGATLSRVWQGWTDPAELNAWYTVRASGEPKEGSYYLWGFNDFFGPQKELLVLQALAERRLILKIAENRITIELLPGGEDTRVEGTRVEVTQEGLPEAAIAAECESGWKMAVALLKFYLESYPGQRRTELFLIREGAADYADFADGKRRRRWLQVPDPPREVVTATGRELLLRWDAVGGALECKSFHSGGRSFSALRASSWSKGFDWSFMRPHLEDSLARLPAV